MATSPSRILQLPKGFLATGEKEVDPLFYLDRTSTAYELPEGFRITSLKRQL